MRDIFYTIVILLNTLVSIGQQLPQQMLTTKDGFLKKESVLSFPFAQEKGGESETTYSFQSNTPGYFVHFKASVLVGKNEVDKSYNASFQLSNGFQFPNGISLGVGSGIEELGVPIIPLYIDLKLNLFDARIAPFLFLRTGYGFALPANPEEYYNGSQAEPPIGGFLFNGGLGVIMFSLPKVAITAGVGYRYQKVTVERYHYNWGGNYTREIITTFKRLELQFGFVFR